MDYVGRRDFKMPATALERLSTDLDHNQSPLGACCGCSLHRQRWVQYPAPKQTMVQLESTIGSLSASSIANPAIEPRAKTPRNKGITFHFSGFFFNANVHSRSAIFKGTLPCQTFASAVRC